MNIPKILNNLLINQEIVFLEADKNYTLFHLNDGEVLTSSYTLKIHEECLDDLNFLRISRSKIVNSNFVKSIKAIGQRNNVAVLANGDEMPIARRRYKDVIKQLHLQKRFI